jgi:hypothetical protein
MRILILLLALTSPAAAATLEVGPGKPYPVLSAAIRHAHDGDRIILAAATYRDCAVVDRNDLIIEGHGADTVITGQVCGDKALLITTGARITLRKLTLAHAHVPDGNGAGIRAEGADLTVEAVRFVDDEDGILTAPSPESSLIVRDSAFLQNGACIKACAHGIYAGHIKRLLVERSVFFETRAGHHIKSRADATIVLDCELRDGSKGTSSYQIELPNGGALLARGNIIEKGPLSENHEAVISIGAEGVSLATPSIIASGNRLTVDGDYNTVFLRNLSATPAELSGNQISPKAQPLQGPGSVR